MAPKQAAMQRPSAIPFSSFQVAISSSPIYRWISPRAATIGCVRSSMKRLTRRWKASGPSRSANPVDPSMSMRRNTRFETRRVVAAGDEIDEHVLTKQTVHVEDEDEHERGRERKQHVSALDAVLAGRGKESDPKFEADQDDAEVDERLHHHMRRKGRAAKWGADWAVHHERIERRQNTSNQRAGQRAPREARECERRPTSLPDAPFSIGRAQGRREPRRPEDVPERLRKSKERHCPAVALLLYDPSLADNRESVGDGSRLPPSGGLLANLHARKRSRSMPAAAKT